jgi:hypothetical protein
MTCMMSKPKHPGGANIQLASRPRKMLGFAIPVSRHLFLYWVLVVDLIIWYILARYLSGEHGAI